MKYVVIRFLTLGIFFFGLLSNVVFSQGRTLESMRTTPPTALTSTDLTFNIISLDWQIDHIQTQASIYKSSKAKIHKKMEALDVEFNELSSTLPAELRLMDQPTISTLTGRIMQQALDTELEIKTKEALIEALSTFKTEGNKSIKKHNQASLRIAQLESELMRTKYETAKKQAKTGLVTRDELREAAFRSELSLLKVRKAEAEAEIALSPNIGNVKRMGDLRIEIRPLKAKLKALQDSQSRLTKSASTFQTLANKNRERDLWRKDLEYVAGENGRLQRKLTELQVLQSKFKSHLAKRKKKKESELEER